MIALANPVALETDALAARLSSAAYAVALRHGIKGSFLDLELDLWRVLSAVLQAELAAAEEPRWRP